MTETREFPIAAVLTVTSGRLLCDIGLVYEVLNFMTGDRLWTHQLPRASDECTPSILAQHPDLTDVVVPEELEGQEAVTAWLTSIEAKHGATRALTPLPEGEHMHVDPISEFRMMQPDVPITVVCVEDETGA